MGIAELIIGALAVVATVTTSAISASQTAEAGEEARLLNEQELQHRESREKVSDVQAAREYGLRVREMELKSNEAYLNRMAQNKQTRQMEIDKAANMLVKRAGTDTMFKDAVWQLWGGKAA